MTVFVGMDVGSVATKAVILSDGQILAHTIVPTMVSSEKSGLRALEQVLAQARLKREDLTYILATGYGRVSAPYAQGTLTEIGCHAKGVHFSNPEVHTVIDMGGQDCKVIKIGDWGEVDDFVMNDKCAAGTGRFFEVLAKAFDVTLDDVGPMSLKATKRVTISSTCTVFAESEVISLMARGEVPDNIINGIHFSLARRTAGLVNRVGLAKEVAMSGGVAKNPGMRALLGEILGVKLATLAVDPQLVGALGAALFAKDRATKRSAVR